MTDVHITKHDAKRLREIMVPTSNLRWTIQYRKERNDRDLIGWVMVKLGIFPETGLRDQGIRLQQQYVHPGGQEGPPVWLDVANVVVVEERIDDF